MKYQPLIDKLKTTNINSFDSIKELADLLVATFPAAEYNKVRLDPKEDKEFGKLYDAIHEFSHQTAEDDRNRKLLNIIHIFIVNLTEPLSIKIADIAILEEEIRLA